MKSTKKFSQLFFMLLITISLCFPVRTFAADNGTIGSILTKANNLCKNVYSRASDSKKALKNELNNIIGGGLKTANTKFNNINIGSKLPNIDIKSIMSIKSKLPNINIKNAFNRKNTNAVNINNSNIDVNGTIPYFLKGTSLNKPSQLIVQQGGKKVETMLNNLSSRQYYVDKNGYVRIDPKAPKDPNKSTEYSIIINSLINGAQPTKINVLNFQICGLQKDRNADHLVLVGKNAFTRNIGDAVLAHELTHAFNMDKGLTILPRKGKILADEEASTIQLENRIRYKIGLPLRTDGSSFDDVNHDGKPDGDNSYGRYIDNTTGPNRFNNYVKLNLAKNKSDN